MALVTESHADLEQKSLLRVRAALERQHPSPDRIVEKWETGAKQPSGTALKLLSIVEKHGLEALS
jgi:DNA-binding transcriptional regulator YiaG